MYERQQFGNSAECMTATTVDLEALVEFSVEYGWRNIALLPEHNPSGARVLQSNFLSVPQPNDQMRKASHCIVSYNTSNHGEPSDHAPQIRRCWENHMEFGRMGAWQLAALDNGLVGRLK